MGSVLGSGIRAWWYTTLQAQSDRRCRKEAGSKISTASSHVTRCWHISNTPPAVKRTRRLPPEIRVADEGLGQHSMRVDAVQAEHARILGKTGGLGHEIRPETVEQTERLDNMLARGLGFGAVA